MVKKLNILVVTHHSFYPVDSGGAIASFSYIDELRKHHNVFVLITSPFIPEEPHLSELKKRWDNVTFYLIKAPEIKKTAIIKHKLMAFLRSFQKKTIYTGVYFLYEPLPDYQVKALNELFRKVEFDIIEVNHTEKLPIIFTLPTHTIRVAVSHEPKFIRTQTFINNQLIDATCGQYNQYYQETFENTLYNLYDATLCFNEHDCTLIRSIISKPVYLSPVSINWADIAVIKDETESIQYFFFMGSGDHYPNYDAILYYKEQIGKAVFEKLGLKLHVIGHWSKEKRENLASEFIFFQGFIEDLNSISSNALMICPIRLGGGIRMKIQWAMAKGVPVISTSFGYEGIPAKGGESILIANSPEQFLEQIRNLLNDIALRNKVRKNANELIRRYFSPKTVVDSRVELFNELILQKNKTT